MGLYGHFVDVESIRVIDYPDNLSLMKKKYDIPCSYNYKNYENKNKKRKKNYNIQLNIQFNIQFNLPTIKEADETDDDYYIIHKWFKNRYTNTYVNIACFCVVYAISSYYVIFAFLN